MRVDAEVGAEAGSRPDGRAPLFVGGDGRSGTTLLSVMLDTHPDVVLAPEIHFQAPVNLGSSVIDAIDRLDDGDPATKAPLLYSDDELTRSVQFVHRCARAGIDRDGLREAIGRARSRAGTDLVDLRDRYVLVDEIGADLRKHAGKGVWGLKIMKRIRDIPSLQAFWPDARFIHVVRDGRDVAASQMLDQDWGYREVGEAARGWSHLLDSVDRWQEIAPVTPVRYEDLVARPELTLRKLLARLELRWSPSVLEHHLVDHALLQSSVSHASAAAVAQPVHDRSVGRYGRDLSREEVEVFVGIAGGHLRRYGYGVESVEVPASPWVAAAGRKVGRRARGWIRRSRARWRSSA